MWVKLFLLSTTKIVCNAVEVNTRGSFLVTRLRDMSLRKPHSLGSLIGKGTGTRAGAVIPRGMDDLAPPGCESGSAVSCHSPSGNPGLATAGQIHSSAKIFPEAISWVIKSVNTSLVRLRHLLKILSGSK